MGSGRNEDNISGRNEDNISGRNEDNISGRNEDNVSGAVLQLWSGEIFFNMKKFLVTFLSNFRAISPSDNTPIKMMTLAFSWRPIFMNSGNAKTEPVKTKCFSRRHSFSLPHVELS